MTGYFTQLEQELVAAAEREPQVAPVVIARRRRLGRRARIALVAAGLLMAAGVPAGAVTGVFRPHREPDGLVRLSERRVIAEGTTSDHRDWELLASESHVGFCFGIRLPSERPGDTGRYVSEGCGGAEPGELSVATSSGGTIPHNGLAFGMAPADAARIRILARGVTVTVQTIDDSAGLAGRFYLAELPIQTTLGPTTVTALDSRGNVIAQTKPG